MTLDSAAADLIARLTDARAKPLHEMTVAEAREMSAAMRGQQGPGPEMARVQDFRVAAAGGSFPVRVLVPVGNPRGVIVYYHGGGWVLGGIEESDLLGRKLAQRSGCAVVLVGYRLAPEYRYPTPVEDSQAGLHWTAQRVPDIAGAPVPLMVAGDSAGGALAAVVSRRSARAGWPRLALQILIYPVTDCDFATTSYTDPANQLLLRAETMAWFWDHYAPDAAARAHPDASPLRAPHLSGLPPAVVITAEHDVLRDEGELYATRLLKAQVPVTFRRFDGQMHGFFAMVDLLTSSDEGLRFVADAIDARLADVGGPEPGTTARSVIKNLKEFIQNERWSYGPSRARRQAGLTWSRHYVGTRARG
jgi:acetyl esterase